MFDAWKDDQDPTDLIYVKKRVAALGGRIDSYGTEKLSDAANGITGQVPS